MKLRLRGERGAMWVLCVFLLLLSGQGSAKLSQQDERDFARAVELRIGKQHEAALALLKRVEERSAANLAVHNEARYQQGLVLEDAGRFAEALSAFASAANEAPGAPSAPYALMGQARVQAKAGQLEKAAEGYTRLLRMYPRLGGAALLARGLVEEQAGRPVDAALSYRLLLRNFPRAAEIKEARRALAAACEMLLRNSPASTTFQETLERGDCLMDQNRFGDAELLYKAALKRRPPPESQVELLIALGGCYEAQGKVRPAERAYRRVGRVLPGTTRAAAARMAIVQIHLDRNRLGDAIRELGKVVEKYPGTAQAAQAQFMIGSCYESLGKRRKAEEAYRKVMELAPQTSWAFEAQQSLMRLLERGW